MGLLQKTVKISKPTLPKANPLKDNEELPLPAYQFSLEIDSVTLALFQSCSGISVRREIETLAEGGLNEYTHELPGRLSYGHVTLQTGLSSSKFFWEWMKEGEYDGRAMMKNFTLVQRRPNPAAPKPVYVVVKKWDFTKAFPVSWKISDLSVTDKNSIVIESLELAFEFFELKKE
jgi:phage tail-like protein